MSQDYSHVIPHSAPGEEDPGLASGKVRSLLKRVLRNGLDMPVRFLQSLRVGRGTGLAGMDGADGAIIANGASASLVMGDQTSPSGNTWAMWRDNASIVYLDSSTGNTVAQLNTLTASALFKNSIRVGAGTGNPTFDGQGGRIIAAGPLASLLLGDTANPNANTWAQWAYTAPNLFASSNLLSQMMVLNTQVAATTMKNSLRVGTGTGLAAFDGIDGAYMANGNNAGYYFGDRAAPNGTAYGLLYRTGTSIQLFSSDGGALMSVVSTNGAAVGKSSLRAGSGTGMAGLDGADGVIAAHGTSGSIILGDRANLASTAYHHIFLSGATVNHYSTAGSVLLTQNTTSGAAVFKTSVRAGSSGAIAANDGTDGILMADGASAAVFFKDRANSNYSGWYRTGDSTRLYSSVTGDMWQVNAAGIITQDALTALTPNTGVALAAGFAGSGTRLSKPSGEVHAGISVTTTSSIAAGGILATVASAHKPTGGLVPLSFRSSVNTVIRSGYINTSGQVIVDQTTVAGEQLNCVTRYYPA